MTRDSGPSRLGEGRSPMAPGDEHELVRPAATRVSTASLLRRIREGEGAAREEILARLLPALRRWAHGRLPAAARDLFDTDDLVQVTLVRALSHLESFESKFEGALFAYLRRSLLNQIRDQVRRAERAPQRSDRLEELVTKDISPLEKMIGREGVDRFERALQRLPVRQQEAVVMRIELGFTYREIGDTLDAPSEDAARKMVARALARLAEELGDGTG